MVKRNAKITSFFKTKECASTISSEKEHSPLVIDGLNQSDKPLDESPKNYEDTRIKPDPWRRKPISEYGINEREEVRRACIKMGPYRPFKKQYPLRRFKTQNCRFQRHWFKKFKSLEYSLEIDAAFFFPCFLFLKRNSIFTGRGFFNWKRVNCGDACNLLRHMGGSNSPHCKAVDALGNLENVSGHIDRMIDVQTDEENMRKKLRLTTSIECARWLFLQACAFKGRGEYASSNNRGNFIEMIKFLGIMNRSIGEAVLENAPARAKYTSPDIQKDILHVLASQVRNTIKAGIGKAKFCIFVDKARDISNREQMAAVLRYVDNDGFIREHFFDIAHVKNTATKTLKIFFNMLGRYKLQTYNLRGQGYDGAGNMWGCWNDYKHFS